MEQTSLVINFTILLAAALVGGMIAHRLKQPVILGYLVIGIVIGPYAFGLVNDLSFVQSAATIGVALLMLTLGLEVSFVELRNLGKVGTFGGIFQIIITLGISTGATMLIFHWSLSEALLFGLVISLSSTMVCYKVLTDRSEQDSAHGRIMLAILILQDVSVILMSIILPLLSGTGGNPLVELGMALAKAALFVGIAIVLGIWVLPFLMGRVGGVRSREIFLLIILVLGLGAAVATELLGLSAVFGAFLVGSVLRETRFAHQALAEITPLRDIFAALFFVSLGMLLDARFVLDYWWLVLIVVALIIAIKFSVVTGIVKVFGFATSVALLAGAGLFQIGEFSFILAQGGLNNGIIPERIYSLLVSSAIITMLLTPISMALMPRIQGLLSKPSKRHKYISKLSDITKTHPDKNLAIIAGFGRIGQNVAQSLQRASIPFIVIDIDPETIHDLRCNRNACIFGDASNSIVLERANLSSARLLAVTYPDPRAVIATVKSALEINPKIKVIARVQRARDAEILAKLGIRHLISPEYEASIEFIRRTMILAGKTRAELNDIMASFEQAKEVTKYGEE